LFHDCSSCPASKLSLMAGRHLFARGTSPGAFMRKVILAALLVSFLLQAAMLPAQNNRDRNSRRDSAVGRNPAAEVLASSGEPR
jgi:hypothetical protein